MYKHLLVPIDNSPLATLSVERAVQFAASIHARITFFHAAADLAATDDGALLYTMDGRALADDQATQGRAELLRARTAADLAGVACETLVSKTDHPARAIHEAARAQGCDLIFISAHGVTPCWRGVTQRLLEISQLPVLVASIESNQVDADMYRALGVISAEHRSIAAVLRGMQQTVREAYVPGQTLNVPLLRRLIDYLRDFPTLLHHPKEEEFLFRLLRLRSNECDAVLTELEREHRMEAVLLQATTDALDSHDPADVTTLTRVWDSVQRLAGALWDHMSIEESQVYPSAARHLLAEDWSAVARAFMDHVDPLQDVDVGRSLRADFAHISASLLAAPPSSPSRP